MKIKPRCHPYWIIDGKKTINPNKCSLSYTSSGYIIPCCQSETKMKKDSPLFKESLKLEKHNSLKTILLSPEWIKFHNTLANDQENAPEYCKEICRNES